jgi:hypothetical protein
MANAAGAVNRFSDHELFRLDYVDGKNWLVSDGFTYWLNKNEFVDIPSGFLTDFASIPRPLKVLWPSPGGPWDLPAVVHDYLYRYAEVEHVNGSLRTINRGEADQIFRDGMDLQEVRESAEACIYRGVRLGGWVAWRRYRSAQ